MKRSFVALLIMFPCFTLTACGTVSGVGEDLQGASDTVKGWF
jgi:predicted small secreted protein